MNIEHHFLCPKKFSKLSKTKVDNDVIKSTQLLCEKFLLDIISRSSTLCKHKGKEIIDTDDISFVVEKDFDYSFGIREITNAKHLPSNEHVERLGEISRQNKMSNSKLLIELVSELNLDVDETTLNTMYKLLDAGMDPENLIEIFEKIKQEMKN